MLQINLYITTSPRMRRAPGAMLCFLIIWVSFGWEVVMAFPVLILLPENLISIHIKKTIRHPLVQILCVLFMKTNQEYCSWAQDFLSTLQQKKAALTGSTKKLAHSHSTCTTQTILKV